MTKMPRPSPDEILAFVDNQYVNTAINHFISKDANQEPSPENSHPVLIFWGDDSSESLVAALYNRLGAKGYDVRHLPLIPKAAILRHVKKYIENRKDIVVQTVLEESDMEKYKAVATKLKTQYGSPGFVVLSLYPRPAVSEFNGSVKPYTIEQVP